MQGYEIFQPHSFEKKKKKKGEKRRKKRNISECLLKNSESVYKALFSIVA